MWEGVPCGSRVAAVLLWLLMLWLYLLLLINAHRRRCGLSLSSSVCA